MVPDEIAVLTIRRARRRGTNIYTFILRPSPQAPSITGDSDLPVPNEEQLKGEIRRAAEHWDSQRGRKALEELGRDIYDRLVPEEIKEPLVGLELPLLLEASNTTDIPWELCHDGSHFLATQLVMSRRPDQPSRTTTRGQAAAAGDPSRAAALIIAPDMDLVAAREEALALNGLFRERGLTVVCLTEEDATYSSVKRELRRGHDIIHICGHAEFSWDNEAAILLAKDGLLMTADILQFLEGSPLVFINACESGRLEQGSRQPDRPAYSAMAMGLPFAFMNAKRGAARIFVGSTWRVEDLGAGAFSETFYKALFADMTVGEAMLEARRKAKSHTTAWANFVLYAEPTLKLTQPTAEAPAPPRARPTPAAEPLPPEVLPTAKDAWPPLLEEGQVNRDRLGDRGREVLHRAELEKDMTGVGFVTTSHLFIGLTKVGNGLAQAALRHQGINPEEIREVLRGRALEQALKQVVQQAVASSQADSDKHEEGTGLSVSVTRILRLADQMAQEEDGQAALVEDRHLLLAFLSQGGGSTRKPLQDWDVDLPALEAFVRGQPGPGARHPLFGPDGRLLASRPAQETMRAVEWAWQEACRGPGGYLATPHLCQALLLEDRCGRSAAQEQGVDPEAIIAALRGTLPGGKARSSEPAELHLHGLSRRVRHILRLADEEARSRNAPQVTDAHVWLAFFRRGGGAAAEAMRMAGLDLKAMEAFVRALSTLAPSQPPEETGVVSSGARPGIQPFSQSGRLDLTQFAEDGIAVLTQATQEAQAVGHRMLDTRQLVLGLAGPARGSFSLALERQGWDADRLRAAIQHRVAGRPGAAGAGRHDLALSRRVANVLKEAGRVATEEQAKAIGERHLALAFLNLGADWTGGGLSQLGLDLVQLRAAVKGGAGSEPQASRWSPGEPAAEQPGEEPVVPSPGPSQGPRLDRFVPAALEALEQAQTLAYALDAERLDVVHLLLAWLEGEGEGLWLAALAHQGLGIETVRTRLQGLASSTGGRSRAEPPQPGTFSDRMAVLLNLANELARLEGAAGVEERHLLAAFLELRSDPVALALIQSGLDPERLRVTLAPHPLFAANGRLRSELLSPAAQQALEAASREAPLMGHSMLGTPHLFLGLAAQPRGRMQAALRKQAFDPVDLRDTVHAVLRGGPPLRRDPVPLLQTAFTPGSLVILHVAAEFAFHERAARVDEAHLAMAFAQAAAGLTREVLEDRGVDFAFLEKASREEPPPEAPAASRQEPITAAPQPQAVGRQQAEADDDLFLPDGQLNRGLFDESALQALDQAAQTACGMNHEVVGTPHLIVGLTRVQAGYTYTALLGHGLSPEAVEREMARMFPAGEAGARPAQLVREGCSENLVAILRMAREEAGKRGARPIGELDLLLAFLRDGGGHAGAVLEGILGVRLSAVRHRLEQFDATAPASAALGEWGIDLTQQARDGMLNPVFGREREMQEVVKALAMKTKNNPILVGEAGVGKTAIVEGLAQRIASGQASAFIRDKRIIQVQMGNLVAGTKYRGQFEERIQRLLEAARQPDVILFIDEIHLLVGAGSAEGTTMDAGNLFKPALARGEVRVIGATTPQEYSQSVEKDSALDRRFYRIEIEQPSRDEALAILRQLRSNRTEHYQVSITDDALTAAVDLTIQYVPERNLPDKAIEVLDRACATVAIGRSEERRVDATAVAAEVAEWKKVPVERLTAEGQEQLLRLQAALKERIIGQDEAVDTVARTVWIGRTGLKDPRRPLGVLLFIGPSGVGKTELALVLAEELFGSPDAAIRLDMSEFQETHTVSRLVGAPPGYVGFEKEGLLTGPLRRRPGSIVLLDEIDKVQSNSAVLDLFLGLFDHGQIRDGQNRLVDGRNALFLMTANVVQDLARLRPMGFVSRREGERDTYDEEARSRLSIHFRPEFLNRIDEVVLFRPLGREDARAIVKLNLGDVQARLKAGGAEVIWDDAVVELLVEKGFSAEGGARALRRAIREGVEKPLSLAMLHGTTGQLALTVLGGQVVVKPKRGGGQRRLSDPQPPSEPGEAGSSGNSER
jgi:ATP-dependent Clp protease ATP-binding subunit ClpC